MSSCDLAGDGCPEPKVLIDDHHTHARTHAVRTTIIYSFWLDACVPSNQQRAARCNSLFFFPDRHIQQLTTTARRPPSPSLTRTGNLLNLSLCCCWTLARQYPLAKRDGWPGGSVEIIGAPHHIPSSSLGVELTITISRSAGAVSESTVALFCGGRNWSERGQCGVGLSGKGRSRPPSISTTPCAPVHHRVLPPWPGSIIVTSRNNTLRSISPQKSATTPYRSLFSLIPPIKA